jgi:replication factor C subunit 3/5
MTRVAQFALRRVIEQYTQTTRFVIIANYVNKIIPALQSRCTSFRFGPLDSADVKRFLLTVADREQLPLDAAHAGIDAVIRLAHGDMRKCLNVMQACKAAYGRVDGTTVYQCTGAPDPVDIQRMLDSLLNATFADSFRALQALQLDKGLSLVDLLQSLHTLVLRTALPPAATAFLLPRLADVERALTQGASERLQLGATVGAFVIAKTIAAKEAAAAK